MTKLKAMDGLRITIHMVSSLDGYIARDDNSIGWFETADEFEQGVTMSEQEQAALLGSVDCYIMGSRTYEHALALSRDYGWAYGNVPTVVLTRRKLPVKRPNVAFFGGSPDALVRELLRPRYRNVWLVGGASLTRDFLSLGLADEIRQSILPIILGGGVSFYDVIGKEIPLHLKQVTAFRTGMVELHYGIKKPALN